MNTPTIDQVLSMQDELSKMIKQLIDNSQKPSKTITLESFEIALQQGEEYAGLVLDESGKPSHHLVLLPGDTKDITWEEATKWAQAQGGELPTRQEQALLYSNCKAHFEKEAYWTSQQSESNDGWAWYQYFSDGFQSHDHKDYALRARAVRRLIIE